jgi:putative MATE family efflux protein
MKPEIDLLTGPVAAPGRIVPPGILAGPIISTLIRLALPTMAVLIVQTLVGVAETYFVSSLGTEALAGVALVFPVLMLMQMMSDGGIGGGVASAVARALGANRRSDAEALIWHTIVLACWFGLIFTTAAIAGAPFLYRAMGGAGKTLAAALTYSNIVFAGSVPLWIVGLLSSVLRGAGNVKVPAFITFAGAAILIPLSPALIFGWGPLPRLGVAGGGAAAIIYYAFAAVMLVGYLRSSRSPLKLRIVPLEGRLFRDILPVGLLSAVGTVQTNFTVTCIIALVGRFGAGAIAGYGIASRLDYLQIPLLFGFGTAVVTMVGVNVGAAQFDRARRIAWIGGAVAFAATELFGLAVAIFPRVWLGLFSHEPAVLETGAQYLRTVGPVYGAIGLGMTLYFASQGAKRVLWPVLAGTARMMVVVLIGWMAVVRFGANLPTLFQIIAIATIAYGVLTSMAILGSAWGRDSKRASGLEMDRHWDGCVRPQGQRQNGRLRAERFL